MDQIDASLIRPKYPLEPSPGFVRPGSAWPMTPAQDVKEVQNRILQSCRELLRLERSMAFIGDKDTMDFDDTVGLVGLLHR